MEIAKVSDYPMLQGGAGEKHPCAWGKPQLNPLVLRIRNIGKMSFLWRNCQSMGVLTSRSGLEMWRHQWSMHLLQYAGSRTKGSERTMRVHCGAGNVRLEPEVAQTH